MSARGADVRTVMGMSTKPLTFRKFRKKINRRIARPLAGLVVFLGALGANHWLVAAVALVGLVLPPGKRHWERR